MKPEHKRLIMIGAVVAGVFVFWRSCLSVIMLPIWLVTSIFIVLAQPDCGKVITRAGGYDAFRAEAEVAFKTIDLANTSVVDPTNYPPTIAALKPQRVWVHEREPVPVLAIQTMGGFNHRGLLVVVATNTSYRPSIGGSCGWVQKELAPGVVEFKE